MKKTRITKKLLALSLSVLMALSAVVVGFDSPATTAQAAVTHNHVYGDWEIIQYSNCTESGIRRRPCIVEGCTVYLEESIPIAINAHVLAATPSSTVAPTCNLAGKAVYSCTKCKSAVTVEIEKLSHTVDPDKWVTSVEMMHVKGYSREGVEINYCLECGTTVQRAIPVPHEYTASSESIVTKQPTCVSTGVSVKNCSICEAGIAEILPIDEDAHQYDANAMVISGTVTCKQGGTGISLCTLCNKPQYVTIPADTEHNFVQWEIASDADSCTADAPEKGVMKRTCSTCNVVVEYAAIDIKHNIDVEAEDTRIHAATCSSAGTISGTCLDCKEKVTQTLAVDSKAHNWETQVIKEATCSEKGLGFRICKYDNSHFEEYEISELGHTFTNEWTIVKKATCKEAGSRWNVCDVCKKEVTEELPIDTAAGHSFDNEWTVKIENGVEYYATCTTTGIETNTCKLCSKQVEREIPCHYSTRTQISYKAPTCTHEGLITYQCKCGETIEEIVPIDPEAHATTGTPYVFVYPTCSTKGYKASKCSYCSAPVGNYTELLPTNHKVTLWTVTKAPTCTQEGEKTRSCVNCDYAETASVPAAHTYTAWAVTEKGDCNDKGTRVRRCIACGIEEKEDYAGSHIEGSWEFEIGNCKEGGTVILKCSVCKEVLKRKTVTAAEHADPQYLGSDVETVANNENKDVEDLCKAILEAAGRKQINGKTWQETYLEYYCAANVYKCSVCGEYTAIARSHRYNLVSNAVPATCTLPGLTQEKYCFICGLQVKPEVVPALGHKFAYDADGTKFCTVCGDYVVNQETDGTVTLTCNHFCHNNGMVAKILTKVMSFFWKFFRSNHFCECGMPHYHEDEVKKIKEDENALGQKVITYYCEKCKKEIEVKVK